MQQRTNYLLVIPSVILMGIMTGMIISTVSSLEHCHNNQREWIHNDICQITRFDDPHLYSHATSNLTCPVSAELIYYEDIYSRPAMEFENCTIDSNCTVFRRFYDEPYCISLLYLYVEIAFTLVSYIVFLCFMYRTYKARHEIHPPYDSMV